MSSDYLTPQSIPSSALFIFYENKNDIHVSSVWKKHDCHPIHTQKLLRGFFGWLMRDEQVDFNCIIPNFAFYIKRKEEISDEGKGILSNIEGSDTTWETDKHLRRYLKMPKETWREFKEQSRWIYHVYCDDQTLGIEEGQYVGGEFIKHEFKANIILRETRERHPYE